MSKNKLHGSKSKGKNKVKKKKESFFKPLEFWDLGTKLSINPAFLHDFLALNGFFVYNHFGNYLIVQLKNGIGKTYSQQEVFNYCLEFVSIQKPKRKAKEIKTAFLKQGDQFLVSKKSLLLSLPPLIKNLYRDGPEFGIKFYHNHFVVVTKKGYERKPYKELGKVLTNSFILSSQIIDRKIASDAEIEKLAKESQSYELSKKATNTKTHHLALMCSKGYCIHNYKDPSQTKVLVISDEKSQANNSTYGRSTKSLVTEEIGYLTQTLELDAKNVDLKNDRFALENVTAETRIIALDDAPKNLDYTLLFSKTTRTLNVGVKNVAKTNIPYSDSPKWIINTNYTIPIITDSYRDRFHLIILNNYWNAGNKPIDHFGNLLFSGWDNKEWQRFDCYMLYCLQLFLRHGLVKHENISLQKLQLGNETSQSFMGFISKEFQLNKWYFLNQISPNDIFFKDDKKEVRNKKIKEWMTKYARLNNYDIKERRPQNKVQIKLIQRS